MTHSLLPDRLSVTEQDLCVMLGNLLGNAVYGCESIKDPFIQLKIMQTSPHALAVKIRNPYTGALRNVDGGIFPPDTAASDRA